MSGKFEMPPFKQAAAILRRTTERLAREVVDPSTEAPNWSDLEWAIARASAAMQGISTLLANRVPWSGPPIWQSFLTEQKEQSLLCFAKAGSLIDRIDDALRRSGIPAVALKGSAIRKLDLYAPGERPMSDVDLLVRPVDLESARAALESLDYQLSYTTSRHAIFAPRDISQPPGFGEHVENPLRIELHTAVGEALPFRKVDITAAIDGGEWRSGLNAYPRLAVLLMHVALHTAGNMRAHSLRQIQLLDIAALGRELDDDDWHWLLTRGAERAWWIFPSLFLSERYCTASVPADVLGEARKICPRLLRAAVARSDLTDVSWSNLRIPAFPGIAWSRTPLEAMRFMRSRLLPSRAALAELEQDRRHNESLNRVPWYGLRHGSRILRWMVSHPPRVQTFVSVERALESANDFT